MYVGAIPIIRITAKRIKIIRLKNIVISTKTDTLANYMYDTQKKSSTLIRSKTQQYNMITCKKQ